MKFSFYLGQQTSINYTRKLTCQLRPVMRRRLGIIHSFTRLFVENHSPWLWECKVCDSEHRNDAEEGIGVNTPEFRLGTQEYCAWHTVYLQYFWNHYEYENMIAILKRFKLKFQDTKQIQVFLGVLPALTLPILFTVSESEMVEMS